MAKKKTEAAEVEMKTEAVEEKAKNAVETEKVTTVSEVKPVEEGKEEQKEPAFIPDSKENAPKKFTAYKVLNGGYSDEQALNLLRKKIFGYKEIHERFLKKVEGADSFRTEKKYVPVYCGGADVQYVWTTNTNGEEVEHKEIRKVERAFSGARAELKANEFSKNDLVTLTAAKKKEELVDDKKYGFGKVKKEFNTAVKNALPEKGVKWAKRGEAYEVVYVPVMKCICMLDGEEYVGYVNLHNGECYSEYKVSEKLDKAAEKAVVSARMARQSLISNTVFTGVLCILTLLKGLYPDWDFSALTVDTTWVSLVLLGLAVLPALCCAGTFGYKKKTMIAKSVESGKLPSAMLARVLTLCGWVITLGAVALFFFKAMI